MIYDVGPQTGMSTDDLETAHRVLTEHADVCLEEAGHVPPWITAARRAVQAELRRRDE